MKKPSKTKKDINKKENFQQEAKNWKEHFELVAMASGQMVYDYNVTDGVIEWGGNYEKILGYTLSEMKDGIKQWEKLIHKDDRKEALRLLKIAKKNLGPYEFEYRYKHKDGHYVNFLDRGLFLSVSGKKSERMVGMMLDITSRKRSEQFISALNTAVLEMQKVFSREEVFKVVARELKKMNIGCMVLLVDDKRKYLHFKYISYDKKLIKSVEKIAGMSQKELIFPIENIKEHTDVVEYKKTVFIEHSVEFINRILPANLKFMAEQFTKIFNFSHYILSPLVAEGKVFGVFSVQSGYLLESDISALTMFAHQLAGAWNKGELIEKIQNDMIELTKAEKALKESEQKSRNVIEQLSEGFTLINEDGLIIEWNKAMENITGRKREDAIDTYFLKIMYKHILPERRNKERFNRLKKMIHESLKKKESTMFNKTFEIPIWSLNGKERILQPIVFPIRLGDKFFWGIVSRDITEQNKLDRENILLVKAVKSVRDAISITDMDNNLLYVNDAFLKTYGYKENEVIGKNISLLVSDKNQHNLLNIVKEETIKGNWNGELINIRKDGTEFSIELWTSVVKDSGGKNIAMVGVTRDITERKQAEKALKIANKKLIRAQKVAKIGSWEIFFPSNERYWSENVYDIMGIHKGITISMEDVEKRMAKEEVEKFRKAINDTISKDRPYKMDYKLIMPDGSIKYIHDEGEITRDKNGKAVSMFGTTQDITESKLKEIALKESEELYRGIFENVPLGMYKTTPEGKMISVNPGFVKILGYDSIEDMINTVNSSNISDRIYANSEMRKQVIKQIMQSRDWFMIESSFLRKDGKIVSGVLSFHSIINSQNGKIEIEGFYTDITKQKQIEENLRMSEERFQQVVENAGEWVWEVNADGLYTYANPIVEKILGYKPEEIINKKHFYDFLIPDVKDEVKARVLEIFSKKEKIKEFLNENLHKNGKIVILETNGVPILDKQNNLLGYRGVDKDITERKEAEVNLRKSEEKFRTITEQISDIVFITDSKGIISYISPAAKNILGYEISEMIGKHFTEMLEEKNYNKVMYKFEHGIQGKLSAKNYELKVKRKDGSLIYVEVNGSRFSVGDFIGTAGTIRDITERKQAEEELIRAKEKAEEMNRVKSSFLANMSHEVRTPLVAILGFSEVLSEIMKDDELKNYVDMIHVGGERLLETLNLILDLSLIEAQKEKIELLPLDIIGEIKEIAALFEKSAKRKDLSIKTVSYADCIILNLDAKMFRQIINNLINNAIKYTAKGDIKVKIDKEKKDSRNYVAIRVEDTGIGIPEDKQNLIWDEFRQVSEGFNRSFEGTGLGLSITKKFVDKLGGEIFLEKSEVNIGSVFTILFPVENVEAIGHQSESNINTGEIIGHKEIVTRKVLYVEDDPISVDIVKAFLKGYCTIDSASTGKEGIEKAKNKVYNAILMDINLGKGIDGLHVVKIIREIPGYKNIPIIAVTAFAMVGDKDEFFRKGCSHYLSKPFTKIELQQLINKVLKIKE